MTTDEPILGKLVINWQPTCIFRQYSRKSWLIALPNGIGPAGALALSYAGLKFEAASVRPETGDSGTWYAPKQL